MIYLKWQRYFVQYIRYDFNPLSLIIKEVLLGEIDNKILQNIIKRLEGYYLINVKDIQ